MQIGVLIILLAAISCASGLQCYNCRGEECRWLDADKLMYCSASLIDVNNVHNRSTADVPNDEPTAIEDTTIAIPEELGSFACYMANFDNEVALGCIYIPSGEADCQALQIKYSDVFVENCVTCTFDGCNNVDDIYEFINVVVIIMIVLLVIAIICVIACVCCTGCTLCAGCAGIWCCCKQAQTSNGSYDMNDCERQEKPEVNKYAPMS